MSVNVMPQLAMARVKYVGIKQFWILLLLVGKQFCRVHIFFLKNTLKCTTNEIDFNQKIGAITHIQAYQVSNNFQGVIPSDIQKLRK